MASFTATGILTTQQSLTTGETGFVTRNGAVLTTAVSAIIVESSATLTVFGSVATGSIDAILGLNLNGARLNIADSGMVIGDNGAAINATFVGASSISNAGQLSGASGMLLTLSADLNVATAGIIQGLSFLANGIYASIATTAKLRLDNSGTIEASGSGALGLWLTGTGQAFISNSGLISSSGFNPTAINASSAMNLINTGSILGDVVGSGLTSIKTSGEILGNIMLSAASDEVRVSGLVDGDINLGNGSNSFTLSGGHVTGIVRGGGGNDIFHIDQSDLRIEDSFGGLDRVFSTVDYRMPGGVEELHLVGVNGLQGIGSQAADTIFGDVGNDTLIGRGGADFLSADDGNNQLSGGAGNDRLQMGEGNDLAEGNAGDDTIQGSLGLDTVNGGLGVDLLDLSLGLGGTGTVVNLATGRAILDPITTTRLSGIENIRGTSGNDLFTGSGGANNIDAATGNDTILGGGGADTLTGGPGADVLTGGGGADEFQYRLASDSNAAFGIDRISDFSKAVDIIDLSIIDAVAGGADDAFVFVGNAAFAGAGAQVRYVRDNLAGSTTIEVRLGNSALVDMTIVLDAAMDLTVANFLL